MALGNSPLSNRESRWPSNPSTRLQVRILAAMVRASSPRSVSSQVSNLLHRRSFIVPSDFLRVAVKAGLTWPVRVSGSLGERNKIREHRASGRQRVVVARSRCEFHRPIPPVCEFRTTPITDRHSASLGFLRSPGDRDDRLCPKRIGNPSEAEETPNSIGCGAAVALVDGDLWERATAVAFGKCAHGCSVRRQLGPVTFHDSLGWGLYAYVARESPT